MRHRIQIRSDAPSGGQLLERPLVDRELDSERRDLEVTDDG
ncbi:MAG: hypothetical protein ABEJ05_01145 [Haloglomus sp.]